MYHANCKCEMRVTRAWWDVSNCHKAILGLWYVFSCQLYKLMVVSSLLSVLIFNINARNLLLFSNLFNVVVLGLCLSMFSKWDIFLVFEILVKLKSLTLKLKSDKGLQYDVQRADTTADTANNCCHPLVCLIQESYLNFYNSYFSKIEYLQWVVNPLLLILLSTRGQYCSKNLVHFNVCVWQTVLGAFTNYFF